MYACPCVCFKGKMTGERARTVGVCAGRHGGGRYACVLACVGNVGIGERACAGVCDRMSVCACDSALQQRRVCANKNHMFDKQCMRR